MWNYVVINSGEEYTDFLAHSAKGTSWSEHKYISKAVNGAKTVYHYAKSDDSGKKEPPKSKNKRVVTDEEVERAEQEFLDASNEYDDIAAEEGLVEDSKTNPGWKVSSNDVSKMSPRALAAYRKRESKRANLNTLVAEYNGQEFVHTTKHYR